MYKHMAKLWDKPKASLAGANKERIIRWRTEPVVVRVARPTRIDRARSLGYKAKQGVAVARVRVVRGGRKTPQTAGGRRPKRAGRFMTLNKSKQQLAEEKAARRYRNMRVLNSYWVGQDGKHKWFEVIMADAGQPGLIKDKDLGPVLRGPSRGRAQRGLTSSGRRARGLRHKGKSG